MEDIFLNIIEYGGYIPVDRNELIKRILYYNPETNFKHEAYIKFYRSLAEESKYINLIRDDEIFLDINDVDVRIINASRHIPKTNEFVGEDLVLKLSKHGNDAVVFYNEYKFYKYCYDPVYHMNDPSMYSIMNPPKIEEWMTTVIPIHYFGIRANILGIMKSLGGSSDFRAYTISDKMIRMYFNSNIPPSGKNSIQDAYDSTKSGNEEWIQYLDILDLSNILRQNVSKYEFVLKHFNGIEHATLLTLVQVPSYTIENYPNTNIVVIFSLNDYIDEVYDILKTFLDLKKIDNNFDYQEDILMLSEDKYTNFMKIFNNLYLSLVSRIRYYL
ncbi:hypothetical protein D3C87_856170 [compost metagenome]